MTHLVPIDSCFKPYGAAGVAMAGSTVTVGAAGGVNHLTVEGFTIRDFKTSSADEVPAGVMILGSGTGIRLLDNKIANIQTTAGPNGNAYGIAVFGTSATPLSVTVSGNTVSGCLTGQSETTTFNGNVQNFVVSHNAIHDNDNIGMDAIGFEGVGPPGSDQAKNGDVYGNLIYNNSAYLNPGEGKSYNADGLYCDGCADVVFERNTLYGNDLGIEATSEIEGRVGSNVIIRNNLIDANNSNGVSVGGYASKGTGGSAKLDDNDYSTTASTTTFELNGKTYSTFAKYLAGSGQDRHAVFANPDYDTAPTCTSTAKKTPPSPLASCTAANFDIPTNSPAEGRGNVMLGTADYGTVDFNGRPRVNSNGLINIGAYER